MKRKRAKLGRFSQVASMKYRDREVRSNWHWDRLIGGDDVVWGGGAEVPGCVVCNAGAGCVEGGRRQGAIEGRRGI